MYDNNPFPSVAGSQILKDMFKAIYRPDPSDDNKLAEGVRENRNYFNSHKAAMVNLMKRFLGGYEPIEENNSMDSGVYVCDPNFGGCGRADFMYNWEFVDMGVYDARNWLGSLELKPDKIWAQRGFPVITRVRCNDYNHCQDCNATFATRTKGRSCIYCGSNNTKGGGCGKEHFAVHLVRETTADNIEAQTLPAIQPTNYVLGTMRGKPAQIASSKPFAFRLTYAGVPNDQRITNFQQACNYIPNLEVGYEAASDGHTFYRPNRLVSSDGEETFFGTPSLNPTDSRQIMSGQTDSKGNSWILDPEVANLEFIEANWRSSSTEKMRDKLIEFNSEPSRYPISKLRFSFTMEPQLVCTNHSSYYGSGNRMLWGLSGQVTCPKCGKTNQPYERTDRSTGATTRECRSCNFDITLLPPFSSPRPLSLCPECGNNTDPINIREIKSGVKGKLIYPRKKLFIKADSKIFPLKVQGKDNTLPGSRTLLIVTDDDEDGYSYELHLADKYTTLMVPNSLEQAQGLLGMNDGDGGSASDSCPKDNLCSLTGDPLSASMGSSGPVAPAGAPVPDPEGCCILPDGNLINTTELGCLALNGNYQGDGTDVANYITTRSSSLTYPESGVSFPAFSWIVCEGHAQSAYRNNRRKWVDMSIPNRVYRDPNTGNSGTLRTFPRFSEGPNYDPRTKIMVGSPPTPEMARRSKYQWMNPRTHMMMDIFKHCSINLRGRSPDSAFANPTHRPKALGYVELDANTVAPLYTCRTCLSMMTYGRDLAFKNDSSGAGNPYGKPWTTIGGAANLREAWNNGSPEKYYPGVEVMWERRKAGQYTGWINDNTPSFLPRRIDVYSETILHTEIKTTQDENGWWAWIHDQTIYQMSKTPGSYII
jgi:hypothetical protein